MHLIPAGLHRLAFRVAHRLRSRWWRWRKPSLTGCRVVALDAGGRVLLVRHSYGNPAWMLPGGGLRQGEDPVAAAARELREETGCELLHGAVLDVIDLNFHGASNRVHLVAGQTEGEPNADRREVVEARFFAVDALPDNLAASLRQPLPDWIKAAKAGDPPG